MKFVDIKPYILHSGYSVDVSLTYLLSQIADYQTHEFLELNPDFQRGYVWTEIQQEKFIEHLLKQGRSGKDIYFNHTRWNDWNEKDRGTFVCVDGLQRLNSCIKFMKNEVKAFGLFYNEFEDKLRHGIGLRIHINNLKTRKEVLEWYLQMNSGGTVHSEDELCRVENLLKQEQLK